MDALWANDIRLIGFLERFLAWRFGNIPWDKDAIFVFLPRYPHICIILTNFLLFISLFRPAKVDGLVCTPEWPKLQDLNQVTGETQEVKEVTGEIHEAKEATRETGA